MAHDPGRSAPAAQARRQLLHLLLLHMVQPRRGRQKPVKTGELELVVTGVSHAFLAPKEKPAALVIDPYGFNHELDQPKTVHMGHLIPMGPNQLRRVVQLKLDADARGVGWPDPRGSQTSGDVPKTTVYSDKNVVFGCPNIFK